MANYPAMKRDSSNCSRLPITQEHNFAAAQAGGHSEISMSSASPMAATSTGTARAGPESSGCSNDISTLLAEQVDSCVRDGLRDVQRRPNLDDLPNEILVHILSYLDVGDLLATSRVSHHFRELSIHPYQHHLRLKNARIMLPHALTHHLRPSIPDLIRKRIYLTAVTVVSHRLSRNLISIRLSRRLQSRPSPEALVQRAVLWPECVPRVSGKSVSIHSNSSYNSSRTNPSCFSYSPSTVPPHHRGAAVVGRRDGKLELGAMDPVIATKKRKIERGFISIRLSRRLRERPTPETLVARAVLWPESVPRLPSRDGGVHVYVAPGIVQKRREVEREKVKDMLRRWIGGKWKGMVRMKAGEEKKKEETDGNDAGAATAGPSAVSRPHSFQFSSSSPALSQDQSIHSGANRDIPTMQGSPRIGVEGGRVSRLRRFWESVGRGEGG